jgi:hypothetical protein
LRKLGKDEKFLEGVIAESPGLLGLESFRHGFFGPFVSFRAVNLESTQGRSIEADVLLLSASGHVVVVEVKLGDNDELHDRRVAAQVIDYATSLSEYERDDLVGIFGGAPGERWRDVVARHFPGASEPAELAETIYQRCRDGEVRVVIACDVAPDTAPNLVKAMGLQASLGFEVKLVEVVPYTSGDASEILFIPRDTAQTEVVATTRVVVEYKGSEQPKVSVVTPSAESVAESVREAKVGGRGTWDEDSFFPELERSKSSECAGAARALYDWAKGTFPNIDWGSGTRGSFQPYVPVPEGYGTPFIVWTSGSVEVTFQHLKNKPYFREIENRRELLRRLNAILDIPLPEDGIERRPSIPIQALVDPSRRHAFQQVMGWVAQELLSATKQASTS